MQDIQITNPNILRMVSHFLAFLCPVYIIRSYLIFFIQNIMRAVHDLNARLPPSEASYGPSPTAIQNAIATAYVQVIW